MGSIPTPTSLLQALSEQILIKATFLSDALSADGLPQPSFDVDGPTNVVPPTASKAAIDARNAVAEAAYKLFALVTGPSELLPNMQAQYQTMFALRWITHFKVLELIPAEGSISYSELALKAKVPESQLKSIARMAMTSYILQEPTPNHVAHSASSIMFVNNENMLHWAGFMFGASIPTAEAMVEATEKWPGSVRKTETAYNVAFNHDLPFFDHLSQSPTLTAQFSGYMKSVTSGQGTDLVHLLKGFDWASLPEDALVVDVGGSTGHATYALAEAYPQLKFEIQDLEPVTKNGIEILKTKSEEIQSRVSYRAHSFFDAQPVSGANVYMLRMIIHDWPDVEAIKIFSNLIPALGPNSKIIIMDTVLPNPGQIPATKERVIRVRDLTMRQVFNAKERSTDDWEEILRSTDSRLRLESVRQPEGSHMSLMSIGLEN
ncbi:O-methyltransferase aurJ [Cladobotryum mycophilum]|uniref:O-methyltransferase aurJ n=1 Tax=Cladobotryum mycophilum TaxID=491253 RepID=A0ABR0S879_9HYPO